MWRWCRKEGHRRTDLKLLSPRTPPLTGRPAFVFLRGKENSTLQLASWSERQNRWGVCSFRKLNNSYSFKCGMCPHSTCYHLLALKVAATCEPQLGEQRCGLHVCSPEYHKLLTAAIAGCKQQTMKVPLAPLPVPYRSAREELLRAAFIRLMSGAVARFVRFPAEGACSRSGFAAAQARDNHSKLTGQSAVSRYQLENHLFPPYPGPLNPGLPATPNFYQPEEEELCELDQMLHAEADLQVQADSSCNVQRVLSHQHDGSVTIHPPVAAWQHILCDLNSFEGASLNLAMGSRELLHGGLMYSAYCSLKTSQVLTFPHPEAATAGQASQSPKWAAFVFLCDAVTALAGCSRQSDSDQMHHTFLAELAEHGLVSAGSTSLLLTT